MINRHKNPVGIFTGSLGSHRFSTVATKRQIDYVKIIDGGEGYSNRKLIVKPTGISTIQNTINFDNHGFNSGELVIMIIKQLKFQEFLNQINIMS